MSFPIGLVRAVLALGLMASLAACGGNTTRVGPSVGVFSGGRSYDPPGPPSDPWGPYIREASRRFDVPERWVRDVMRQESGGRATATSPVGAMGLMQVMPGTYRELRGRYALGDDPYHPYDSIMAGTAYIREMYDLFGSPAFLAAYNAGPRRLENFLYNRGSLPAETRNYIARIGPGVLRASPVRRAPPEVYAAAEIPVRVQQGPRRMDPGTQMALREQRDVQEQNARFARLPDPEPAAVAFATAQSRPMPAPIRQGNVVAMEPIADGSTPGGAQALAESAARGTWLASFEPAFEQRGGEQRVIAGRMEPIPDGSTPEGAAALAESASRAAAFAPINRPVFETPVRGIPTGPGATRAGVVRPGVVRPGAARPGASPALAMPLPPRTLGFIGSAQAASVTPTLRPVVASGGGWAVQVGAFSDERQARSAAQAVGAGRVEVQPVRVGRSTLFRARAVGLSQGSAQQVCGRLRGPCIVLSPDAQG